MTNSKLFMKVLKLRRLLVLNTIVTVLCVIGMIIFIGLYTKQVVKTDILEAKIEDQSGKIDDQQSEISELNMKVADQQIDYTKLSKVASKLDNENSKLVATLSIQQQELDELKERQELYDKYEYALVRQDGSRTDIDYEDILTLEELAKEEGLGEDAVSLVLAISVNESRGYADVKNPNSTAAGLCGLLNSTAKYSWEVLMDNGKGSYKSAYVYDPLNNLEMALEYVAYLKEHTDSNYELLVAYRGKEDSAYIAAIKKYTGKSIPSLDL